MESYMVKFSYKKDDGYFEYGKEEVVYIESTTKDDHQLAEDYIKNKYKNVTIVNVSYI